MGKAGEPANNAISKHECVVCNLCGRNDYRIKYKPSTNSDEIEMPHYLASVDRYGNYGQIVKCNACGLVYTNPRPQIAVISQVYGDVVDKEYGEEGSGRSINAIFCLDKIKKFKSSGRLLDIGCATGYFLNAARLNYDVHGVELSKWAVEYAKNNLKLSVDCGNLLQMHYDEDSFDVITMIDFIEHVSDPKEILREVYRILKKDGIVYIVTPSIKSLSASVFRSKWWGLRAAHIYYFSPRTLKKMLYETGFEARFMQSFGRIFTLNYWLSRLVNYNKLIYGIFSALINKTRTGQKLVYINTLDSIEILAAKAPYKKNMP